MTFTKEDAKKLNILDVARSLDMNMLPSGRSEYYWQDHDSFKINIAKNMFKWYSRDIGGDVIKLVQVVKDVSYKEAMTFLETGEFKEVKIKEIKKEPFKYHLGKYETDFTNARKYLTEERGISNETIDYFLKKGVLSSVNRKTKDGYEEQVIVFKYLDSDKNIVGGSMQGIVPNKERYAGKGYLKQIMYNSDNTSGFNIQIGDKADNLIFFEAPIDMMSYYELNKDKLNNVKLIAMDGLKEGVIARYFTEKLFENSNREDIKINNNRVIDYLDYIIKKTTYFEEERNKEVITLAVDNDKAGLNFINKLKEKGINFQIELPNIPGTHTKVDWNELLNNKKERVKMEVENIEKNTYWVVDFNEKYGILKTDYAGRKLTRELIEELKELDNKLSSNEGYYKFYFNKIENGEVVDKGIIDIGYGLEANLYVYEELYRELELLDKPEESIKKDLVETRQNKNVEGTIEDFSDKQKAAPLPDEQNIQPLNDLSPNQTKPQPLLNFNTLNPNMSINKRNYHPIKDKEIRKLNRYAPTIQTTAKWYLNNLADSKVNYFYKDNNELKNITVEFRKEHFMHLTGIFPIKEGQTAEKTLLDFANGNGNFDNIMISDGGSTFQKLQVLPEIEQVLETTSFYFDNLTDIEKLNRLDLGKAIQSEDKDLLMLFKQEEENLVPASIMKIRGKLSLELDKIDEKVILGIYRERFGKIEQLDINKKYIKDGGRELKNIIENNKNAVEENKEINTEKNIIKEHAKSEIKKEFFNEALTNEEKNKNQNKEEVANKTVADYIKNNDTVGLNKLLKEGIKEYENTDIYKNYLKTMSKFTRYSRRNVDLIFKQNPKATAVASYKDWINKFGRQVKKGEKGISIIGVFEEAKKDKDGNIIMDSKGNPEKTIHFKKHTVFDVSQTEGKELPKPIYNLEKEVDGYFNIYKAINLYAKNNNVEIEFKELDNNANGVYYPKENKIYIQKGLSGSQTIKTLLHELAHSKLHRNLETRRGTTEYNLGELEAESIAYVVSNYFGIDTSEYSFGYLKSYMSGKENYEELDNIIQNIHTNAKEITSKIEHNLNKIKGQVITKLEDKINKKVNEQMLNKEVEEPKKSQAKNLNMI